jgi:hypothetical protein
LALAGIRISSSMIDRSYRFFALRSPRSPNPAFGVSGSSDEGSVGGLMRSPRKIIQAPRAATTTENRIMITRSSLLIGFNGPAHELPPARTSHPPPITSKNRFQGRGMVKTDGHAAMEQTNVAGFVASRLLSSHSVGDATIKYYLPRPR